MEFKIMEILQFLYCPVAFYGVMWKPMLKMSPGRFCHLTGPLSPLTYTHLSLVMGWVKGSQMLCLLSPHNNGTGTGVVTVTCSVGCRCEQIQMHMHLFTQQMIMIPTLFLFHANHEFMSLTITKRIGQLRNSWSPRNTAIRIVKSGGHNSLSMSLHHLVRITWAMVSGWTPKVRTLWIVMRATLPHCPQTTMLFSWICL
jgi:hypothetical protein